LFDAVSLIEAMQRLLYLALDKVRAAIVIAEDELLAIVTAVRKKAGANAEEVAEWGGTAPPSRFI